MQGLIRGLLLWGALLGLLPGTALAREWVSVRVEGVHMRDAPSTRGAVLWKLGIGYPLRVLERKGRWVRVTDFENDRGWVATRLTTRSPHVIVSSRIANVRRGPGTRHPVLSKAEYGEVFRLLDRRKGWVRVRGDDGRTGWMSRGLVWGP